MHQAQAIDVNSIVFDERDLDAALGEASIATDLPIEVQRGLASRVLVAASLATAIERDDDFSLALEKLGAPPSDREQLEFFEHFSRSLMRDLNEEVGDEATVVATLTRRIGSLLTLQ